jgi:diaminopimelate decarboxylase
MINYKALVEKYGSPLYVYDLDGLRQRLQFFKSAMPVNGRAHFAVKSNNNPGVLKVLLEEGFGIDAVSEGELEHALRLGFKPQDIVLSGVGKTLREIESAIRADISQINIESAPELLRVAQVARKIGKIASVALRMNPDVDANTHPYIRTGFRDNKFGLDFSEVSDLLRIIKDHSEFVRLQGLTLHIGSQIRETAPFEAAIRKTLDLFLSIRSAGHDLRTFDVGGGVGIDYGKADLAGDEKMIQGYMDVVKGILGTDLKVRGTDAKVRSDATKAAASASPAIERILFEPGRILVGRFGTLVTEVQYVKRTPFKNFLIVDTGMHHLMRPALYEAHHEMTAISRKTGAQIGAGQGATSIGAREVFDVVGPICESTDVLGSARLLASSIESGDLIVIHDVGAYGAVMANDYNMRPRAKEICVSNNRVIESAEVDL